MVLQSPCPLPASCWQRGRVCAAPAVPAELCPMSFSIPAFWAVEAGAGQPLPPREVVLSNGSLQVLEPSR